MTKARLAAMGTRLGRGWSAAALFAAAVAGALAASDAARAELGTLDMQSFQPGQCCFVAAESQAFFASELARGDFNEDGFTDLVIGSPGSSANGVAEAGKVAVLRGTASGLTAAGQAGFTEAGFGGTPEEEDHFGGALGVGDWNGDGADDLAIGIPSDHNDGEGGVGGVWVIYGNDAQGGEPGSLFGDESEYWSYATVVLGGFANTSDHFGSSFATGDFNGDGLDDLAIGVPGDNVYVGSSAAGSITILMGSASGLIPGGGNTFHRQSLLIPGAVQNGEQFGFALAAGDFDGDGDDELAVSGPGRNIDGELFVGEVVVLGFEIQGLGVDIADEWSWSEGHGIPGAVEETDYYGWSLAAGDFDGDGADDLAIGAPYEGVGADAAAGAIALVRGQLGAGPEPDATLITQDDLPLQQSRPEEYFGLALAAGDFDADGGDELVIGAPGDTQLFVTPDGPVWISVGAVHVLPGGAGGPWLSGAQDWIGTPGGAADDGFGAAFAAGRFAGGPADALAIGSPSWNAPGLFNVGRLSVLFSKHIFSDSFETGNTLRW